MSVKGGRPSEGPSRASRVLCGPGLPSPCPAPSLRAWADAASPALVSCPSALVASLFGLEAALTLKSGEKLERKNRVVLLSL